MPDKTIASIQNKDAREMDILRNKIFCAKQAAAPDAVPEGLERNKAVSFFREAIFALGDA